MNLFSPRNFPNRRPRPLERLQIARTGVCTRLFSLHQHTSCCPLGASAAQAMESTFWSVHVKQAWDSAPVVPEAQPPLLPVFSEDRGPWPLPFYPSLGSDYMGDPLQVLQDDFDESCLTMDSSSMPGSFLDFYDEQEDLRTPGPVEDSATEMITAPRQTLTCWRAPLRGEDLQDIETSEDRSCGECKRPATGHWRRRWQVFLGLLERIAGTICCVPRG
ncbi:annexin-2 receptor [Sigmodon hispidus]